MNDMPDHLDDMPGDGEMPPNDSSTPDISSSQECAASHHDHTGRGSIETLPNARDSKSDRDDASALSDEEKAAEDLREALEMLAQLRIEHRRIDQEISAMQETGVTDMLKISRMKKIKLSIKDQIAYLENQTTPDIIA